MRYLTYEQIIRLDQRTVERHGGKFASPHNFLREDSLHYLLEAVKAEMFGEPLYPTIADKAAIYMHGIISNHIFQDGNKRTGIGAALVFLQLNGFTLKFSEPNEPLADKPSFPSFAKQSLYNFTLSVAAGRHDLPAVRTWFAEHVEAA